MTVYEQEVPGVGHKFEIDINGGRRLVVIVHHDGKRDLYLRPHEDADSEQLVCLTGKQARQLGAILEGAYFQPVELDRIRVPLGAAIMEWVDIPEASPLAGCTLQSANIRRRTGTSVIAIQRGDETIPNPKPEFTIEPGDILVAIGTREELASLGSVVETEAESNS